MLPILTVLSGMLGNLPGIIGDYFKTKQQIQLKQLEVNQQLQLATIQAQAEAEKSNSERAITVVKSTTQWFKVVVFILFSVPFVACLLDKVEYAQMVFSNLASLPEWYVIIYTGIVAIIWGIPVGGNLTDLVVKGISNSVQNRRAYKLTKKGIDPKEYFDALRVIKGGVLTQSDVDEGNRVLDKLIKD